MKKVFTILVLLTVVFTGAKAGIKIGENAVLGGYVKSDMFFDTRNGENFREGHFFLYPKAESLDADGKDMNEQFQMNMISIQTRLNLKYSGPEVWGAKSFGFIEGEFFGTSNSDVNGFRLRHAFVDLNWGSFALRAGQTWHPLFDVSFYANTLSFNTGVPFQPFARNPQIRADMFFDKQWSAYVAVATQRDFTTVGVGNAGSSDYLRNSGTPDFVGGIKMLSDVFSFSINGEFKMITPRTSFTTDDVIAPKTYKLDDKLSSFAANAYFKLKFDDLQIKGQGMYGQNTTDLMTIGGFTEKLTDPAKGVYEYKPINILSTWGEVSYGKDIEVGVFFGYTKNLGQDDKTVNKYWGRGASNIESIMRVSPRAYFTSGDFKLGAEIEYTSATYGIIDVAADPQKFNNTKSYSNIRAMISFIYNL